MAIYTYRCPVCDRREEVVQSIASYCERPDVPSCPGASNTMPHGPMERYLTPTLFTCDATNFPAFKSTIDGEVISSRSQQKEHMSKHGVVLFDDMKGEFEQKRKEIQKSFTADLKTDLVESIHKLDAGHKPNVIRQEEFIPAE